MVNKPFGNSKAGLSFRFVLILWLSLSSYSSLSQSYNYIHYSTADGLPATTVYSALQDHKGYMWFSTTAGVCRFDGKNFQSFTIDDGLTDNEVFVLKEDSRHRMWCLTFNGKLCYFF